MGPVAVVHLHPIKSHLLNFTQIGKQVGIQNILPKRSIQTLNECILGWFARLNKLPDHMMITSPFLKLMSAYSDETVQ